MIINHNMNAMNAHRMMTGNTATAGKSMEKLSSGLRINKAGDDAAGLAISEKMRGQIRGLDQASRNAQDSISLIQTAEGALNETHSILQRMRELSVQSSNETNTGDDRNEIQKEMDQLIEEIDRIANNTEFNTKKLINGEASGVTVTAGSSNVLQASLNGANSYEGTLKINVDTAAVAQVKVASGATDANAGAKSFAAVAGTTTLATFFDAGGNTAFGGNESLTLQQNGKSVEVSLSGSDTFNQVVEKLNQAFEDEGMNITASYNNAADEGIVLTATKAGSAYAITTTENNFDNGATLGFAVKTAAVDAVVTLQDTVSNVDSSNITVTGDTISLTSKDANLGLNNISVQLTQSALTATGDSKATLDVGQGGLVMQIGANQDQTMAVNINSMNANKIGQNSDVSSTFSSIDSLKTSGVTTTANASKAITLIDKAIKDVSAERSKLGAYTNRLEHTTANLSTSSENLQASESRIRDVDMAKEMMTFSKNNILSQAAQAMLAQANQQPQGVLQLLR